jgi:YL1 nuclear protein C-terminal domain
MLQQLSVGITREKQTALLMIQHFVTHLLCVIAVHTYYKQITGQPAKYRDPLTGYPYADAAAFKELRKRYGAAAQRKVQLRMLVIHVQSDSLLQHMLFAHVPLIGTSSCSTCCICSTQSVAKH